MQEASAKKSKPFRRKRIERQYGGHVVLTAPNLAGTDAFLARVERFLVEKAVEIPLFPEDGSAAGAHDIDRVIKAAETWSLTIEERQVWRGASLAYEPVRKPPVDDTTFRTGVGIELRGVSFFVAHAQDSEAFAEVDDGLAIVHEEPSHITEVKMSGAKSGLPLSVIKDNLSRVSPVTQDVLALLLANAFNNEPDSRGYFTIDVDDICEARNLERKKTSKYSGGHHVEARVAVVQAIRDLSRLFVAKDPASRRDRRRRVFQSVLLVDQLMTMFEDGGDKRLTNIDEIDPKKVTGVRYGFGEWFEEVRAFQLQAPRSVLALDAQREGTAKRLGHYFVQRALDVDKQGRIIRDVRTILRENAIKPDPANPQRLRTRIESAFEKLVAIRTLDGWGYVDGDIERRLPAYKWLEPWLREKVWVRLA